MRLVLLIRALGKAGAEVQLRNLSIGLRQRGHDVIIVTFYAGGAYEMDLRNRGIRVFSLRKKGRWDLIRFVGRWLRLVNTHKPDIVYSFMTGANIVALFGKLVCPRLNVVWGIRTSSMDLDLRPSDKLLYLETQLARYLSRLPELIITNSDAGNADLISRGYDPQLVTTIHNGVDLETFGPRPNDKTTLLRSLGLPSGTRLIGIVGRLHPIKNHEMFLNAAQRFIDSGSVAHFLIIGGGDNHLTVGGENSYVSSINHQITDLKLSDKVTLLGEQNDMAHVYNGLDITTICSKREATPNVLLESMACGTPVVATEVGDIGRLLNGWGILIGVGDVEGLVAAWRRMLARIDNSIDKQKYSWQLSDYVYKHYSTDKMVNNTIVSLSSIQR